MKGALRAGSSCVLVLVAGCDGAQSALDPAGHSGERLADLFWLLTAGTLVIWAVAVALWVWGVYFARRPLRPRERRWLLVGGGGILPVTLLAGVLTYSLAMLPDILESAPEGSLRVEVTGYQWWWRVRYIPPEGDPVESANEVRLPVNEPVRFDLVSQDVIHSFWIPPLGGKMDMIPGRRNTLSLLPTETGTFRGTCAEYCGTSHALMALAVVVQEPEEFERWLATERAAAASPQGALEQRGEQAFLASGCGACHAVRGTPADGSIGPDLTHVGGRMTLGAGTLPTSRASLRRFVAETERLKPGVRMPSFDMLPDADLDAIAAYLASLR
ncbi:MAG: cytochrome c oxidase subunit II [Gemmatimonadales bacterium]